MELISPLLSSALIYGVTILFLLYKFSPNTRKKIKLFFFSADKAEEFLQEIKMIHLSILASKSFSSVEPIFLDYFRKEISDYSNLPPEDSTKRKAILASHIQKAFDVTIMLWHADRSFPSHFFKEALQEYEKGIENIKRARENPLSTHEAISATPYFDIRFHGCNIYKEPPVSLANFLSFIYRSELDSSPFMQDHTRELSNKPLRSESEYLPFTGAYYLRKLYLCMFKEIQLNNKENDQIKKILAK